MKMTSPDLIFKLSNLDIENPEHSYLKCFCYLVEGNKKQGSWRKGRNWEKIRRGGGGVREGESLCFKRNMMLKKTDRQKTSVSAVAMETLNHLCSCLPNIKGLYNLVTR